ncbi:MAG: hypothetical protein U0836_08400 [Pirellulales bacterium]
MGDQLLFTADDGDHGRELWVSGAPEGTKLATGPQHAPDPRALTPAGFSGRAM